MSVCNNTCNIYPCVVAEPDSECRLMTIPKRVRESILLFYNWGKLRHLVMNLVAEAYLESLTTEPNEKMIKLKMELAEKISNILRNVSFGRDMLSTEIEDLIKKFEEDDGVKA